MSAHHDIPDRITKRIENEVRLLPPHLQRWTKAHCTPPREINVSLDPEGTQFVRVWLVTDDTWEEDGSSRVVYDAEREMFGLVMELKHGVLW